LRRCGVHRRKKRIFRIANRLEARLKGRFCPLWIKTTKNANLHSVQTLIFTILIILFGSALFSGIEAALFSVSLSKAKILSEKKKSGAISLAAIKENMRRPLTVIVIFNNAFNIVGSIIVGFVAAGALGSAWIGVISAVLTFLIIIFGEIVPKSIGENYAERISLFVAKPLLFVTKIFFPFIWAIEKITGPFMQKHKIISEEEIKILSHLGHLEGSIEKDEKEMIQKVFRLNDLTAKNIMTPRAVIVALDGDKTLQELEEKIYSLAHSRLPVFRGNADKIIGVCHQRDLLIALGKDQKERKISEFSHEVTFVSENTKADKLLPLFQKQRCHMAIVAGDSGIISGLVTLEDVLEQLVGEIIDETDAEIDARAKEKN
jgi:CBS domain containing-hemolysin-like protein